MVAGLWPGSKEESIALLEGLLEGDGLKRYYEELDELSRMAVSVVSHGDGHMLDLEKFVLRYGAAPQMNQAFNRAPAGQKTWHRLDLLFTRESMPGDLKRRFAAFVPPPVIPPVPCRDSLPETVSCPGTGDAPEERPLRVCETMDAAAHDLLATLRLIDAGGVAAGKTTGRPAVAGTRAVHSVLLDGDFVNRIEATRAEDFIRAFAWPLILQAAGLVRRKAAPLSLTKAGREALAKPPHRTIKRAWESWADTDILDEFTRIAALKGKRSPRWGGNSAPAGRKRVTEALAFCPVGKWVALEDFFRHCRGGGFDFHVTTETAKLYITDSAHGCLGYGPVKWSVIQGRFIMALLWEYMATLGMVDIAWVTPEGARDDFRDIPGGWTVNHLSRYDGLRFFRITRLGAYCLGMDAHYAPPEQTASPVFSVLPNRDVVVQDKASFHGADAVFLGRIACRTGDHAWVLDPARLLAALEAGVLPGEITAFLDGLSLTPVPATVRRFLDDLFRRAFLVNSEGVMEIYRTSDEATALMIAHDSEGKNLCQPAGPCRLAVLPENTAAFLRVLRRLGHVLPARRDDG
ncbi:MAG: hypothetical protein GXY15_13285 [Candidatus Hydrogenedentes bacterium]|nr:hypothetical protein [Candidatus Hydrogenedentota bacterium]